MPFHYSFVEVPTNVDVITYSAYAILTIEQQKRENKKIIREIFCIKPISSIFKVQSYITISCDS
jgi:hypothetical protein